jgi:hypothetical protein
MKRFLPMVMLPLALALSGCGLFGGDDGDSVYTGPITVEISDNIPQTGTFTRKSVYPPEVREVVALVRVDNARAGMKITSRWYQLGTLQNLANLGPHGFLVTETEYVLKAGDIGGERKTGETRVRLIPNAPLPEDAYVLRVYIDGKLARTVGFIIRRTSLPGAVEFARRDLARRLNANVVEVVLRSAERVEWPDACIGFPRAGEQCAQVVTPGYRLFFVIAGQTHEYHTDTGDSFRSAVSP